MDRDRLLEHFAAYQERNLSPLSLKQQLCLLKRYLPAENLGTITSEILSSFFTDVGSRWAVSYLRKVYRATAVFFAWCHEYGHLSTNPMDGLPRAIRFVPSRQQPDIPVLLSYATYLRSIDRSTETVNQRVGDIRRFAGDGDPLAATPEQLGKYLRRQSGWSQEYRRKIRASFVSFYEWAYAAGLIPEDPSMNLQSIRPGPPTRSPIDEQNLLEAFYGADLEAQAIIALAGSEGLRRSEIARLHTRGRSGFRLTVHGKGDRIRVIPLNQLTYELLVELEQRTGPGYYFRNSRTGRPLHHSTVYKRAKAHIGAWSLHSLRHRTATIGLRRHGNVRAIQELFGHASLTTTQIYTDISFEDIGQIVSITAWPREPGGDRPTARALTIDLDNLDPAHVPLLADALSRFLAVTAVSRISPA